jgi:hypothetical protein
MKIGIDRRGVLSLERGSDGENTQGAELKKYDGASPASSFFRAPIAICNFLGCEKSVP